ncbi:MAG: glycosyltransferase family 4 protein [Rhodospirillales bacterium]|nr:glycosyltransferase family 4 protein [Rhodospirillales bacterium]
MSEITFIGHPFAPIGMGEQLRSHVAASLAVGLVPRVYDIYRYAQRNDESYRRLIDPLEVEAVGEGLRVFHVNADEVDEVLSTFSARGNDIAAGVNVIVPAWELPDYPPAWAAKLRRFDQVWALSRFIAAALRRAGIDSRYVGQSVEPEPGPLLPRRSYGIRESAFVLLHFFDLSSYASRKNPQAVLALFERLREADPFADIQLVLKVKNIEDGAEDWAREAGIPPSPQIKVIATPFDALGVRGLIAACDVFVSLHRAEGFGRGLGEAMALGRLALGTGWSGNTDFMTPENSLLVRHKMVRVRQGAYPHGKGQSWAEADIAHAAELLAPVLADPSRGRALAERGRREVLTRFSNRAVGLRIAAALAELG